MSNPTVLKSSVLPRWTAYDAEFFGLENIPDDVPMVTRERAYSSPIWYTPAD